MRPIDADALLNNIKRGVYTDDLATTIAVGICETHIKAMPTIKTVPIKAVPLEPLCKFLAQMDCISCRVCNATIGFCKGEEAYDVCNSKERWKEILTKFMEDKHDTK